MLFFLTLIYFLISPTISFSQGEFKVSQNLNYEVDTSGNTKVKQEIELTNKISQIYAKEYQIIMSGSVISNLKVTDSQGNSLDTTSSYSNGNNNIFIKFLSPAVGKNQTNHFSLEYNINNFASKKGRTWELQFPTIENKLDDQQTNVELTVPDTFGELSFSSVSVASHHVVGNSIQIKFSQSQFNNKVLLIFGENQLFDFRLLYHITNNESVSVTQHIPIPPDTNTQTITYQQIDPYPSEIKVDPDGNWLAAYEIEPNQQVDVTVVGQAKTHLPVPLETGENLQMYTSSQLYWETENETIRKLASTLNSPKDIHQYVVRTLSYDYSQIDLAHRKGAVKALSNPETSLCTEFTDLFVTLSRSKGIPAREIEGYAFSNNLKIKPTNPNSDVLHAWPPIL